MKVIGLAGWSGAGKTTLLKRVIPHLLKDGLRVSVIKHAHHEFDVDVPGKDSWEHRQAGAAEVLVSSSRRWALMHELRGAAEPRLQELLAKMAPVDLVIVEGFKREPHRKIEVHRAANGKLVVTQSLELPEPKTKAAKAMLEALGLKHALIVLGEGEETFFRAARNLAAHKVLLLAGLNVYDVLNYDEVLMSEPVARAIEARLKGQAPKGEVR